MVNKKNTSYYCFMGIIMTLFIALSSLTNVKALDNYVGTFLGEDAAINQCHSDVMLLGEVDGYSYYTYQYNYSTSSYVQYVNTTTATDYNNRIFMERIYFPGAISSGSTFDFSCTYKNNGGNVNDFYQVTFYDTEGYSRLVFRDTSKISVAYDSTGQYVTVSVYGIDIDFNCPSVAIFHRIEPTDSLTVGCGFTSINVSTFNEKGLITNILNGIINLPKNIANSIKGFFDNVVNAVTNLGNFIIDGLKSLFIPGDGFFTEYFDGLYSFFSDKLGFLITPFELLYDLFDSFLSIGESDGNINIPNIIIFDTVLISATTFNLRQAFIDVLGNYYNVYLAFIDVMLLYLVVNLGRKKFEEIVGGNAV